MKTFKTFNSFILSMLLLSMFLQPIGDVTAQTPTVLPSGLPTVDLIGNIDAFVEKNQTNLAGMAVAVFSANDIPSKKYYGYSDIQNQIAVSEDTVFEWGSVTKLLIWISILQLEEQGKLTLENDVRQYLPENFLTKLKDNEPITITDLMNHQAGFQEVFLNLFTKDIQQVHDLETSLRTTQPSQIYDVGEVTSYSNWGAALAALVVERVSGMSFLDYAHKAIFEPLGMSQTALWPDLSDNNWVQRQREKTRCYSDMLKQIEPCHFYIPLYPAGMATGTLHDLLLFAQAINPKGNSWNKLFDSQASVERFFEATSVYPLYGLPRNAHGMWASMYSLPVYGHGGNSAGMTANLLLEPQSGLGMVIMTNQSSEQVFSLQLPEVVFGVFDAPSYGLPDREIPQGFFRSSRTIAVGPFSLMKNLNLVSMEEGDQDSYWELDEDNGRPVLRFSVMDFFRPGVLELGLTLFMSLSLTVGGIYALVSILITLFKKRPTDHEFLASDPQPALFIKLCRWKILSLVFILLTFLNTLALIWGGLSFMSRGYFNVVIGIFIILVFLSVWQLVRLFQFKATPFSKNPSLKLGVTTFFLIVAAVAIVFFQFYQFWNL